MKRAPGIVVRVVGAIVWALVVLQVTADSTNMPQAHKAMEIGRSYKSQGDLQRAEHMFRLVMKNSPEQSNIHLEAKDELEYYIPLMRIQRLLWNGNAEAVERELFALQKAFEGQPVRLQEINRILNGLQSASPAEDGSGDREVDEKQVMRVSRMQLDAYFRQNNSYPTTPSTLSEALDLSAPPLAALEIERYSSNGTGYLLVLRKKDDRSQTITLQHTGLLQ